MGAKISKCYSSQKLLLNFLKLLLNFSNILTKLLF